MNFTSIWCSVGGNSNPDTLLQCTHTHTLTHCILPQSTPVTAKRDGLACCHSPPLPKRATHSVKVKGRFQQQSLKSWTGIKVTIGAAKYKVLAFLPVLRCRKYKSAVSVDLPYKFFEKKIPQNGTSELQSQLPKTIYCFFYCRHMLKSLKTVLTQFNLYQTTLFWMCTYAWIEI